MTRDFRYPTVCGLWALSLSCCLLLLAASGCSEKEKPVPPSQRSDLKPAVSWLDRYYRNAPLANDWKVSSVASQGAQVQVMVEIPAGQASTIMRKPAEEQFRAVASAVCPPNGGEVYRLLPPGTEIKVLPALSGQVFIEVDCGH